MGSIEMKDRAVLRKDGWRFYLDGHEVGEAEYRKRYPAPKEVGILESKAKRVGIKPTLSEALAVHPAQVAEATADAKARGVPTEFMPDGRPVMRSREHQRQYLKAYGFHNNDGGYGD